MASTRSLFNAIRAGDLQVIRKFFQSNRGLDVNTRDFRGQTPLRVACLCDDLRIVKFLIQEMKANVNTINHDEEWAPLVDVCCHSDTSKNAAEIAELLLANEATVNARVYGGGTALHLACIYGTAPLVQVLLNHGAHINTTNFTGQAPLHSACTGANIDVIKLLLVNNADRHIKNMYGQGPMDYLRRSGHHKLLESYDKLSLAVSVDKSQQHATQMECGTQGGESVRLNPLLSQHQHALAIQALLLVRRLPVHEVAYEILGFLSPASVEKIFLPPV